MIKKISFLLLICLCFGCFSACSKSAVHVLDNSDIPNSEDVSQTVSEGVLEDSSNDVSDNNILDLESEIDFKGQDYILEFDHKTLTNIYINPECDGDVKIVIPETTEDGSAVTKVSFGSELGYLFLPIYTKDAFEEISEKIKESGGRKDAAIFNAYYMLKDINNMNVSDSVKENMLKNLPACEYGPIYICDSTISAEEILKLERIFKLYTDIDTNALANYAIDFLNTIPDDSSCKESYLELLRKYITNMNYTDYDKVSEIVFHDGIFEITTDSFPYMANLKKVGGLPENIFINNLRIDDFIQLYDPEEYENDILAQIIYNTYKDIYVKEQEELPQNVISGNIAGHVYTNDVIDIGWTLPENWYFLSDTELDMINFSVLMNKPSAITINEYLSSQATWAYTVVSAKGNTASSETMKIILTKITPEKAASINISSLHSQEYLEQTKQKLQSNYGTMYTEIKVEPKFVAIGENNHIALNIQLDDSYFCTEITALNDVYLISIYVTANSEEQMNIALSNLFKV